MPAAFSVLPLIVHMTIGQSDLPIVNQCVRVSKYMSLTVSSMITYHLSRVYVGMWDRLQPLVTRNRLWQNGSH